MQQPHSRYWFPAKRYGWGWGAPSSWQGWLVLLAFVLLLVGCSFEFPPNTRPLAFAVSVAVLCAGLFGVCFAKGEPPEWRWGK